MPLWKVGVLTIYAVLQSACSGLISQPSPNVPVEESGQPVIPSTDSNRDSHGSNTAILDLEPMDADLPAQVTVSANEKPAIIALLNEAEQQQSAGRISLAAAAVERAIRLQPNNALLWSRLAQIRLEENNWQQAYVLANKSNSLARTNRALQIQNWSIIEQARLQQGDEAAAAQARSRIQQLSVD